jgi:hypothetical protein
MLHTFGCTVEINLFWNTVYCGIFDNDDNDATYILHKRKKRFYLFRQFRPRKNAWLWLRERLCLCLLVSSALKHAWANTPCENFRLDVGSLDGVGGKSGCMRWALDCEICKHATCLDAVRVVRCIKESIFNF